MSTEDIAWLVKYGFKKLYNGAWIFEKTFEDVVFYADVVELDGVYTCNVEMNLRKKTKAEMCCCENLTYCMCKGTYIGHGVSDKSARSCFAKANIDLLLNQTAVETMFVRVNKMIENAFNGGEE